jgi:hypothetical protein
MFINIQFIFGILNCLIENVFLLSPNKLEKNYEIKISIYLLNDVKNY